MADADKTKIIKIAVAAVLLLAAGGILAYQFISKDKPQETKEMKAAAAHEEAVNQAAQQQQQSKPLEIPEEVPREQRAPRTVIGR
jgi:flagellar basal body-associated protein FliL